MQEFAGGGGLPDLAQFRATMQAVEQACSAIQMHMNSAAAEATIVALHQSPHPYQCCRFILENSELANARFQAAGAIRDAAIREWGILTDEDKKSLIFFCLWFVMKHATATDGYVQNKVSAVAAQLIKRGWLDFTASEKEGFFSEVSNAVLGMHGADAQFAGINFLESLVSEFSPPTSSAMGLPAEFHEKCKSSLEEEYLQRFYRWAQDAALSVTNNIIECSGRLAEERVCSAALRLMFQILNWDFKCSANAADASNSRIRHDIALLRKFECTLLQPGPLWRDVLIASGHIIWLLGLYETMKKKYSYDVLWIDSPLAVSARQLIVQLCSLTGSIFPSDHGQTQEKHLLQILSAVVQWIDPPSAVIASVSSGQTESEMLDGCHALLSIATLTSTPLFDNLLKSIRSYGTLGFLSTLTCEIIKALEVGNNEEETWCSDASDILLETWNILLGRADFDKSALSSEGIDAIFMLFNTMMESRLKAAAASAFDEDDNSEHLSASVAARDERFSSYALIARTVAGIAIPLLIRLFSERFSLLFQGKGATDPTCTLEELYWLLLITGHVLTDSGQGETVLIPETLQAQFVNVDDTAQHPVVVLSWSIINFAEKSLDPDMRAAFFSPRLMEAIIWFLSRWVDTYLMPVESGKTYSGNPNCHIAEHAKNALISFSGDDEKGKSLLDIIVRISLVIFTSFPGETELQTLTCQQLLAALVRRKNVCVHLVSLDSWHSLSNAFVTDRTLFSLPARLQRSLAEALVSSVSAMKESEASNQYVTDLMGPMTTYLVDMFSKDNLKAIAQQPDVIFMVSCLLERLRGAARATEPRTQKAVFDVAVSVMGPLLTLLEVYKDQSAVVYLVLKFIVDFVNSQVVFLCPKETAILVSFCIRLLQIYSSHNIGKISLSLSTSLLNEVKTEKYKDLRALLQLLTHLCSKDLVDFSLASPEEECPNIAEVVFLGLHIVTPLISLDLLKYPKLCKNYFELLSHMLEVYLEKFAQLNMEAFKHVVETLDFGIHQQDTDAVDMCLRAVNALASHHYKERTKGNEGLGAYAMGVYGPDGKWQEGFLGYFLQLLLQLLLFEDFSMELAGSVADALLPLVLCEQDLYQRLVQELIERQPNPALKSRLANALKSLTNSNQLSPSLDRVNRQRFRKNVSKFLINVSGFLRIK
uniref:Exportin-4 n=1 Tax=Anthurium amnicola TaxID=1678845 RepID=A0A1D1XQV5_9ARAE